MTSALDLTLAFIEADAGPRSRGRWRGSCVTYLQRPGNQAQMSMFTAARGAQLLVQDTIDHVAGHLGDDLSTAALASRAGVSERHLTRLFLREVEATPAGSYAGPGPRPPPTCWPPPT